jgi:hypothetical protein
MKPTLLPERRSPVVMSLALSDAEVQLLQELLHGDLRRLLLEIHHTHHRSMREGLKAREALLEALIQKLEPGG